MKYIDEEGEVRILIAKKHPFKGMVNYFMDSLLYQYPFEAAEDPSPEDWDSGNEADTETDTEEEYLWEINSRVTSIDKLNFNNTVNIEGEWSINENLGLAYLFALASDSVPPNTNTDIDSDWLVTDIAYILSHYYVYYRINPVV